MDIWNYLAIAMLLLLSAFFSGSEIAYASISEYKLRSASEDDKGLVMRLVSYIHASYDDALTTILIGNNLVNIAASSVATVIAISLMGDDGAAVATGIMTLLILTFGEILPKILASRTPMSFARLVSLPLRALMFILKPVTWLLSKLVKLVSHIWEKQAETGPSVTEDDLESIIETVEDEGVIDEERCDLLQSALDFDDVLAYEIITPRVDLVTIDIGEADAEIKKLAQTSPYTRIPVYEDTIDNVIGILHLNHYLKLLAEGESPSVGEVMMPVNFVHKTMALPDVLKTMKKRGCHMVVVTDEYGGTMGVLTMEDVLEQLVGEIWDESDIIETEFNQISDDTYEADGDMRIEDFFEELDIDDRDFDDDNATLGGWAIEMLGGYPKVGDTFEYKNLFITVKKLQNLRVLKLLVKVLPMEDEQEDMI